MDIQKFLNSGVVEKYVLGLADRGEMDYVEQMAKDYPEVNEHICKMQNCMEEYVEMHAIRPPRHLKHKIMASLSDEADSEHPKNKDRAPRVALPLVWRWASGIAALLLLGLGLLSWNLYEQQQAAQRSLALLATQIKHLQNDQANLETLNEQIRQKYSVLKDITTQQVKLKGSQHAPQALVVVYWNPEHNKGYLNIVDLPQCPSGHEYQLWADVNGKHKDMGVLKTNAEGTVLHSIPYIKGSRGFVITLEKEGGSPHPTVEKMYATGSL